MIIALNITKEEIEQGKRNKSKDYDVFFFSCVDKLGKTTKFDIENQTLYLGKDIKSDNPYLRDIMDGYKFWIGKSLI